VLLTTRADFAQYAESVWIAARDMKDATKCAQEGRSGCHEGNVKITNAYVLLPGSWTVESHLFPLVAESCAADSRLAAITSLFF
jgi:hypothetical protein